MDLSYYAPFALTATFSVLSTLAGAWIKDRLNEGRAARDVESGAAWRSEVMARLDALTEASHVTMRGQLMHNAEKYVTRGWVTPEERQAWWDMFNAYDSLGKNGYIADYWLRIQALPIREV